MIQAKANLTEVSKQAGVSMITASRAIRGVGRVNPETRKRILEAAEMLGYRRHGGQLAPGLGQAATADHCLRILLPVFRPAYNMGPGAWGIKAVKYIRDGIEGMGGILTVVEVENVEDLKQKLPRAKCQGIVLRQVLPADWLKEVLMIAPVVYAISHDVVPKTDALYFNEFKASTLLYDKLLSLGHTSIAWVGWERSDPLVRAKAEYFNLNSGFDRQAFNFIRSRQGAQAVLDLGMVDGRVRHQHLLLSPQAAEDGSPEDYLHSGEILGRAVAEKILNLKERPTAVVVNTDHAASYTYKFLMQAGVRIPREMSLVTYGLPESNIPDPLLVSGIQLPFDKLGAMIPEIVQRRWTNPSAPYISVMVEPDFVDHGTLSQAPRA